MVSPSQQPHRSTSHREALQPCQTAPWSGQRTEKHQVLLLQQPYTQFGCINGALLCISAVFHRRTQRTHLCRWSSSWSLLLQSHTMTDAAPAASDPQNSKAGYCELQEHRHVGRHKWTSKQQHGTSASHTPAALPHPNMRMHDLPPVSQHNAYLCHPPSSETVAHSVVVGVAAAWAQQVHAWSVATLYCQHETFPPQTGSHRELRCL